MIDLGHVLRRGSEFHGQLVVKVLREQIYPGSDLSRIIDKEWTDFDL